MGPINQHLGEDRLPGMKEEVSQPVREPFLLDESWFLKRGVIIEKNSVDVGNTNKTHTLRAGTVLTRIEQGANAGKWVPADHADAEASNDVLHAGILQKDVNLIIDTDGTLKDMNGMVVVAGRIDEDKVNFVDAGYRDDLVAIMNLCHFEAAV